MNDVKNWEELIKYCARNDCSNCKFFKYCEISTNSIGFNYSSEDIFKHRYELIHSNIRKEKLEKLLG